MAWSEKVYWLYQIWHNPHINLFIKIKAIFVVTFFAQTDDDELEYEYEYLNWYRVAYGNHYQYSQPDGLYRSWDTLCIKGTRWTIYQDSNM